MSMFRDDDPIEKLVRGIEVLANPTSLLNSAQANTENLFSDTERKSLEQVDKPALLKLARSLEIKHEQSVNFTNMIGG
jgi:hypothetical protein